MVIIHFKWTYYEISFFSGYECKDKIVQEPTKSNAYLFPSILATKALQYDEITTQHAVTRGLWRIDLIIQGWMWWALLGGH